MIYEVINPVEPMTISSDDEMLACIAIILLGGGNYGLDDEAGNSILPALRFSDPTKLLRWLHARGITDENMDEFYRKNGATIAAVLESISYGSFDDRKAIEDMIAASTPDDRLAVMVKWNNEKRTTENEMTSNAHKLAKRIRTKLAAIT